MITFISALLAALALLFAPHPVGSARSVAPPSTSALPSQAPVTRSQADPPPTTAPPTVAPPAHVVGPVAPLPYSAPGVYCPAPGEPTLATDDPACQ